MNEFNYRITEQVYNWIVKGNKNIEIRLYNEKSSQIKVNDIINFKVLANEEKSIKVKVIDLLIYKDIESLLKDVDIKDIAEVDGDTLKNMLYDIFGEEKVKSHNIIGIKFEIIDDETNDILIDLKQDKEPYIKQITKDKIINLTGESGSGKSYYARKYINDDNYIVIDTDEVFARYEHSTGINKELGSYFRNKYETLPSLFDDFDLIYDEIITFFKDYNKTIVIDSAQFRNMKDIDKLKGTIIVIRTSIDNCYKRSIERFKNNYPNATKEELNKFSEKKKGMYKWYLSLNEFILKIDNI